MSEEDRGKTSQSAAGREFSASVQSSESLRMSLSAGAVGSWDWNVQDDRFTSSEENYRLHGLEPDQPLSFERWLELIHPEDRGRVERVIREALSSSASSYDAEFRVPVFQSREQKHRWLWTKGTVLFDENGAAVRVLGVNIDITDRKQIEREQKQAEVESRKASELKDDFLAMLGHELRNPLGAIANGIELLRSEGADQHREWAEEMIHRQSRQLKRLVDDILEVSRVNRGQIEIRPEVVSLTTCIEVARDALRERLLDNPRDFSVHLPEERTYLFVDPARMQQILGNLLMNAIKYTDAGGHIELSARRQGDHIVILVEDDGEGLTEEQLEIVFEPFVRVSRSPARAGSGLGIGLTLVKKLVEMHEGTVSVDSEGPGMGCRFAIELPVYLGEPPGPTPERRRDIRPLRILVIDDNKDLAVGLKKRLEGRGHQVTLAHDGPTGITAARRVNPHVVLVDVGLPGLDGYQVARKLREMDSTTMQIAGISGFKERGEEDAAGEAFDHYFLKPVDAEQLSAWLTRVSMELKRGDASYDTP